MGVGRGYKPLVYDDALQEVWCQQAGMCMAAYDSSNFVGMSQGVDGTPCQQWKSGTSVNDSSTFCVTAEASSSGTHFSKSVAAAAAAAAARPGGPLAVSLALMKRFAGGWTAA